MTQAIHTPVPTHIITGFLGSGKTTLIRQLMAQKPAHETWAILVNEFGEIGIDGQLLGGQDSDDKQVFIKEVPGGCMCCTSGLPMQIAMAQLLSRSKPDRLFIEPTGLGHPHEVVAELQSDHNRDFIQLMAIIALFDARKLIQAKYHQHDIFKQQLEIADILVANKTDLYAEDNIAQMQEILKQLHLDDKILQLTEQGALDYGFLAKPVGFRQTDTKAELDEHHDHQPHDDDNHHQHHHAVHHHSQEDEQPSWQQSLATEGHGHTKRHSDGFVTEGWIYDNSHVFEFDLVFSVLSALSLERLKGVFITEKGIFGFNQSEDVLTCIELDETEDSRLEIIYQASDDSQHSLKIDLSAAIKTKLS